MKHHIRLVAKGYWGVPSVDESTVALLPSTRARTFGLLQLRDGKSDVLKAQQSDTKNNNAVILAYDLRFSDAASALSNQLTEWSGTKTDFVQLPAPFAAPRSGQGIAYTRSEYGASGTLSLANFILQNGAFSIRAYVFKPAEPPEGAIPEDEDAPPHIVEWKWAGFSFQLRDGKPVLFIESEVAAQTAAGEAIEGHSLSLGEGIGYNSEFTLTFIPEPSGRIHVILEGSGTLATVEIASQLKKKTPGIIWPSGALRVTCGDGAMIWQVGYPRFALRGALYLGNTPPVADAEIDLDGHAFSIQADTTGAGTSVLPALDSVQLKTTNRRFTPFWYGQWGTRIGGVRSGIDTSASWDSDEHLDAHGYSPIITAGMQWDGDDESLIVANHYDLGTRDVDGTLAIPGFRSEALENRVCDLYIDGARVLKNGVVKSSQRADVSQITRNLATPYGAACVVLHAICTPWLILDEDLMMATPPGDGLRLGAYLRLLFLSGGFSTDEIAGISAGAGIVLPRAALGETPRVINEFGQSRGEYIRTLLERWAFDWRIFYVEGVWHFTDLNQNIVGNFSSSAARNNSETFPGRLAMLEPIDRVHDAGEVFNWFAAQGEEDGDGSVFAVWQNNEGIFASGGPGRPEFIGRRKRYPIITDDRIQTMGDAAYVVRSTAAKRATGARGVEFSTYFHADLFSGARLWADDVEVIVKRIPDADIFGDSMRICTREVD